MLNIMVIEGYVRTEPEIISNPKDETKFMFKFQVSTLNGYANEKNGKYIWVTVVAFCGLERLEYLKQTIHKDDYVSCVGKYCLMSNKNRYYSQLILDYIDLKFAKGSVPHLDTISQDDNPNDKKEMNW